MKTYKQVLRELSIIKAKKKGYEMYIDKEALVVSFWRLGEEGYCKDFSSECEFYDYLRYFCTSC